MKIFIYFIIYYTILFLYALNLNIGTFEVLTFEHPYKINCVGNFFLFLFGKNNFALRLPSLIVSMISIFLYYKISKFYFKNKKERYYSIVVFSLLPGFIIASILYNKSIYSIFFLLLFIYSFFYYRFYSYILLLVYTIVDESFISLYFALIFYSIYKKDNKLLIYSLLLLMINAHYFHYNINGHPKGHFLNLISVYLAIFSPFVFMYFLYSLIKIFKKPNLLWFISLFSLLFSIILSFRQNIKIDDYAPFVIISVIFMVYVFLQDYRIRLKIFRKPYKILLLFLFFSLLSFDILLLSSKFFFNRYIVNQFKYSKELYLFLKIHHIDNVYCNDDILCKKLYFYGINKGNRYYLIFDKKSKKVSILHNGIKLYDKSVSKLYKK
jgi:hypothetical protein